jgi:hypothetical protein
MRLGPVRSGEVGSDLNRRNRHDDHHGADSYFDHTSVVHH